MKCSKPAATPSRGNAPSPTRKRETTALVAADTFGGSFVKARAFLKSAGYMPDMLSGRVSPGPAAAQGHRRPLLRTLFFMLAEVHKTREDEKPREEDGSNRRERLLGRQLPGAGLLSTSESTVANSTKMRNVAAIRPANGDISTA
jgi:hypothetical protein